MPNVGGKKFPYTRQGQKAARRYGRQTGQPVSSSGGGYGGGTRGNNPRYPHSVGPVRPSRPGNAISRPRSLPPVPGRRGALAGRPNQIGPQGPRQLPKRPGGPGIAPPRSGLRRPGSGGSRVMRNPGISGRPSRVGNKNPGVGPGRVQRMKPKPGGGY